MIIAIATWASVIVLGPGALAVFIWFLRDLRRLMRDRAGQAERGRAAASRGGPDGTLSNS